LGLEVFGIDIRSLLEHCAYQLFCFIELGDFSKACFDSNVCLC